MSRVLVVFPDYPLPENTGLHMRMMGHLDLLQRLGCETHILFFSTEQKPLNSLDLSPLSRWCSYYEHAGARVPDEAFSPAAKLSHKLGFLIRGGLGVKGRVYPFSKRYDVIGAESKILVKARAVNPEFILLPSFMVHYAECLKRSGFGVIADAIDVLTDLTRSLWSSYSANPARWIGLYANYLASKSQERLFLKHCCEIWATSPQTAEALRGIAPEAVTIVVPNSIDEKKYRPAPPSQNDSVGFIGTYTSMPNLEGALFLADQVWPLVFEKVPTAKLLLAGSGMDGENSRRLNHIPGVYVLGQVPDSAEFMTKCTVLALPVFVTGGVPLKIVEAMALGKAIVVNRKMIEGVDVTDGRELLVRGDAREFAEAIVRLLQEPQLNREMGQKARETFLRTMSRSWTEENLRCQSILSRRGQESRKEFSA